MMSSRYIAFITVSMLLLFLFQSPSSYADREVKETEEKAFKMEPGGTIKITADEGYVRISSWDRSEVEIRLTKYARGKNRREAGRLLEQIEVDMEQTGNRLIIRELETDDESYSLIDLFDPNTWNRMGGRSTWVNFDVTVPRETNLDIITDEGDIIISSADGKVEVDTDEGNIELYEIRSHEISVITDEGDMLLEHIRAPASASSSRLLVDTDEGNTELADVEIERVKIESDEGNVTADMLRCERFDFYSDEGSIEADLAILPGGDYRCRTDEGEIILFLPRDASFSITARSQEGEIRSDFPIEVKEIGDGERIDDVVGDGGADIYLFVDEGRIRLREK
ncbi:MAG: DUF4097 family beta strand repeat protein [Gemmatimonadota bacterium]|nr:MAG: DUF4097 family beta strand repeat protein [Gemmatimonadota bacterium]